MWIADGWEDYELLDCGGGEKLERWGKQILVRPDPQAIWETPRRTALAQRAGPLLPLVLGRRTLGQGEAARELDGKLQGSQIPGQAHEF